MEPPAPRLEELTARLAVMLDEHHVAGAPAEELAKLIVEVIRQVVNAPVSFGAPTPAMIAAAYREGVKHSREISQQVAEVMLRAALTAPDP